MTANRHRALGILLLTFLPLLTAAADYCGPASREPGTPVVAPHAVFEAYVIEVQASQSSRSEFGPQRTRRALVEVVRSFHGPYGAGQKVETLTIESSGSCGSLVADGGHVMVASGSGGPFEIVEVLSRERAIPAGPFAAIAYAAGEARRSPLASLANVSLRGEIDAPLAARLHARARPGHRDQCEIASDGHYAQVSWGSAFGGNDSRHKVIFERSVDGWIEILRYEAPTPSPARDPSRKSRQRALWAEESGVRRLGAASAMSRS
jgi:hypothetical protein